MIRMIRDPAVEPGVPPFRLRVAGASDNDRHALVVQIAEQRRPIGQPQRPADVELTARAEIMRSPARYPPTRRAFSLPRVITPAEEATRADDGQDKQPAQHGQPRSPDRLRRCHRQPIGADPQICQADADRRGNIVRVRRNAQCLDIARADRRAVELHEFSPNRKWIPPG
jgi:hypothetical protein